MRPELYSIYQVFTELSSHTSPWQTREPTTSRANTGAAYVALNIPMGDTETEHLSQESVILLAGRSMMGK